MYFIKNFFKSIVSFFKFLFGQFAQGAVAIIMLLVVSYIIHFFWK